jgi:ADP-ribose pyrophosphatase YjhB (NUDIX family)
VTTDDEAARFTYLAEGNAGQARKRVAADVLIRDEQGRILLVNPTYKPFWDLPGGMAEANESPRAAAERELREELGLTLKVGRLLTLDWQPPHGPWDDQLIFTFDGGSVNVALTAAMQIDDSELAEFEFLSVEESAERLRVDTAERLELALAALTSESFQYTERTA